MTLERRDLHRATITHIINKPIQTIGLETPEPITNARTVRTKLSSYRGFALSTGRQQHHPRPTVQSGLTTLVSGDLLQRPTLPPRKPK